MPTYKVVRADPRADRATIIDLLTRNEPDVPRHADQYAWHVERNPHGEGRMWLLLTEPGGKPIGASGIVMRRVQVGGETRLAARAWGISVEKEHRSVGPALQLCKAAFGELERDVSFLWVLPYTRAARNLFLRAGYKKGGDLDRHVRVLRSRHYLETLAQKHPKLQHPLLQKPALQRAVAGALSVPADLAARLNYERPWERPRHLAACWVRGFDRRFDELWERARGSYAWAAERGSDFLGWRFRRAWDTFLTVGFARPGEENERLSGYAVVGFRDSQAVVADLFLEDPAQLAPAATWLLCDWVRSHGFESVCLPMAGCAVLEPALERHGFKNRTPHDPALKRPVVEESPDEVLVVQSPSATLPDVSAWHFNLADDI
jgi:hypothetical protein